MYRRVGSTACQPARASKRRKRISGRRLFACDKHGWGGWVTGSTGGDQGGAVGFPSGTRRTHPLTPLVASHCRWWVGRVSTRSALREGQVVVPWAFMHGNEWRFAFLQMARAGAWRAAPGSVFLSDSVVNCWRRHSRTGLTPAAFSTAGAGWDPGLTLCFLFVLIFFRVPFPGLSHEHFEVIRGS